jgi:hypothetical protein
MIDRNGLNLENAASFKYRRRKNAGFGEFFAFLAIGDIAQLVRAQHS